MTFGIPASSVRTTAGLRATALLPSPGSTAMVRQELVEGDVVLEQVVHELVRHGREVVEVREPEVGEPELARQLVELDLVGQRVAVARGQRRLAERHVEDAGLELAQAGHLRFDAFP